MSSTLSTAVVLIILIATQLAVTHWLFVSVLELPSNRPLRAAVATLVLTGLVVGPAVAGFDALVGDSLSFVSRVLLFGVIGVVQTGLVLRMLFRTSMPLAIGHGLILQMTWAAMSLLTLLCGRLGMAFYAAPLALFAAGYAVRRFQDRELTRLMDSIPPTAPPHLPTAQA